MPQLRQGYSQINVDGQEITMAEAPEGGGGQVIDLMEALRASLEKRAAGPAKTKPAAVAEVKDAKASGARKPPKKAEAETATAAPAAKRKKA